MAAVSWLATNVDWLVLVVGGVSAFVCVGRSMKWLSAVMLQVSGELEGDQPTERIRLKQMRRGMQWGGGSLLSLGLTMLTVTPTWNAAPVVAMGFAMVKFPGLTCAPVAGILMPMADHNEPIGPAPRPPRYQYEQEIGPVTLDQWLDSED